MGLVAEAIRSLERRSTIEGPLPLTSTRILEWLSGATTASGVSITPESALRLSAVYACVRMKSEDIAKLPLHLYQQQGRTRMQATAHPLYNILHRGPNPYMTAMQFRETLQAHVELRGNAYANIERDGSGTILRLWPLRPDRMAPPVLSENGTLLYRYTLPSGEARSLTDSEVFHLRGLSSDGIMGYGPIALHRETLGWSMAAREYGARFYSNDSRPGGILQKKEGWLSEEAAKRLRAGWESAHRGLTNSHRIAVLEDGIEWKQVGISQVDAEYLGTLNYQIQDVARIFRVPPHKIGELSRATFSNIEEQEIEYVVDTLQVIAERWEQQIYKDLLLEAEQGRYFVKHNFNALLRGKTVERYQAYMTAIQNGILSPNDVRELEDLNPFDGGDIHLQPLNMVPFGTIPQPAAAAP